MKIASGALRDYLHAGCKHPLFLLYGPEFLLVENSVTALREAHRALGFTERVRYTVDRDMKWGEFAVHSRAQSLFGGGSLVELRMPGGRPGEAGARQLAAFAEQLAADDRGARLLVICGALDRAIQASKWFKTLEGAGLAVEHRAVGAEQLPKWIAARMRELGLRFESEAPPFLAHFLEGNLLAADQEVQRLQILCGGDTITVERVQQLIADHARFTVFQFVDAALQGKLGRALRILANLRREGLEPVVVNWALAREVRALAAMARELEEGQSRDRVFKSHRVWSSRAPMVGAALKRLDGSRLRAILAHVAATDRMIKGRQSFMIGRDAWNEFEAVTMAICGKQSLYETLQQRQRAQERAGLYA